MIAVLSFTILCGFLGIFLRRNYLNTTVSLLQVVIGINSLLISLNSQSNNIFPTYLIIFTIFIFVIFTYSISVLLIKRRSTIQVNELTELRG